MGFNTFALFEKNEFAHLAALSFVDKLDLESFEFTPTKIKDFLQCPLRFYLRHVKKLKDFETPSAKLSNNEVGNLLHDALRQLFEGKSSFDDASQLHTMLLALLTSLSSGKNETLLFEAELWSRRLQKFCEKEVLRFKNGYSVFRTEVELGGSFEGFKLTGKVDRIDKQSDLFTVLDYKTGEAKLQNIDKKETLTEFQLPVYHFLVSSNVGKVAAAGYYKLKEAEIEYDEHVQTRLELLTEKLQPLKSEFSFEATDEIKSCYYCAYKKICARD